MSSTDARSLNGLLAVIDRYQVGQIVSVEVKDNRVSREWLDVIAAKQIKVIEAGSGIGIEEDIALMLDESGWARIDAGATSVGVGVPGSAAHVDVLVLDKVTDNARVGLQPVQPSIVVVAGPIDLPEGSVAVDARENSLELVFDGVQWEVKASP